MINNPLVSIITPSFNQGKYLEETILSVLNQTYKNIEYIVIDGASVDNSVSILKKYSTKISFWISEKDNGQADAINKGFKLAKGDFLCWVNSDDLLYPDFIERRMKEFAENKDADMIYGDVDQGTDIQYPHLRKGEQQTFIQMLETCIIKVPQMSAVWRREVLEITGLLNCKYHVLLDWEYFLRIAKNHKIKYVKGSVAFFRQHDSSKSIQHNTRWAYEIEEYYNEYFNSITYSKSFIDKCFINMYIYCAELFYDDGKTEIGNSYLIKAKSRNRYICAVKRLKQRIIAFLVKLKKLFNGKL